MTSRQRYANGIPRAIPALSIHQREFPAKGGPRHLILAHTFYSLGNLKGEFNLFPEGMRQEDRLVFLDDQAKMMMTIWKSQVLEFSAEKDCFCTFARVDWKTMDSVEPAACAAVKPDLLTFARDLFGSYEDQLLMFAREHFGKRIEVVTYPDEVASVGRAAASKTDPAKLQVFVMGEYTCFCVPLIATLFAYPEIPFQNVFVMRELSVDLGHLETPKNKNEPYNIETIVFGDPRSRAIVERKKLGYTVKSTEKREIEVFEDTLVNSVTLAKRLIDSAAQTAFKQVLKRI